MHSKEKLLDDIARIAGGAVGVLHSARNQAKDDMQARIDEIALRMDLVPRSEFERLEKLLQETRLQNDALEKRVAALESK